MSVVKLRKSSGDTYAQKLISKSKTNHCFSEFNWKLNNPKRIYQENESGCFYLLLSGVLPHMGEAREAGDAGVIFRLQDVGRVVKLK